jgi:D-glycero-D-manno-heptose 1,7-bisphosphate phosphatase
MSRAPGVLVDRDGTLIRDVGYLNRLEQIELLPRAADALRLLAGAGLKTAVVTNQSAVGRGLLDERELEAIHREIEKRLAANGAKVDRIYYCPHHPTEAIGIYRMECNCRKPDIGMARRAAEELELDLQRSYVIGDKESDMELAAAIGARGFLIGSERRPATAYNVVKDIWQAAEAIIRQVAHAQGGTA